MYPVKPTDDRGAAVATGMTLVRRHYKEMPSLSLDLPQAVRFIGLDKDTMCAVFDALADGSDKFLVRRADGRYVRYRA